MAFAQIPAPSDTTMTELSNLNIIITDRLVLRPLRPTDRDAIRFLRFNPQVVAACLAHRKAETGAELDAFLERVMEGGKCVSHCVEPRASSQSEGEKVEAKEQKLTQDEGNEPNSADKKYRENHIIGVMGAQRVPEIGYMFLPEYWGKGYATEALKAWMEWYWIAYPGGHVEREYLNAITWPEAVGSQNVLQKCGFMFLHNIQQGLERNGKTEGKDYKGKERVMLNLWIAGRPPSRRNSLASS